MLKIELPANLRELAREVMAQTRGNYEQIESAVNEMMTVLASTQSTASKGIVNYRAWLMKVAHGNVISAFDFAQNLATAKLAELAHNFATEMAEPINASIASAGENAA